MTIESIVERFILEEILIGDNRTKIAPDESLVSSNVIDSLAILRLISFLEEEFGIQVDDEELVPENFETLNEIKAFVENKKANS